LLWRGFLPAFGYTGQPEKDLINPRLIAISGAPREMIPVMKDGPLFLGRDSSNQVKLGDAAVSRKHCSVSEVSGGVFEIADLDSHNGTYVNGTKVSRQTIQHGDRIRLGSCEFVFLTGADEPGLLSPSSSGTTGTGLKTMSLDRSGVPTDAIGLGRMALSYPELLWDASMGNTVQHKRVCRTFSDCTTAPRNGLPSGCYPLDAYYKKSEMAITLSEIKNRYRKESAKA